MVINFSRIGKTVTELIEDYRESLIRYGEFTAKPDHRNADGDIKMGWFNDLFDVLDEELDHRDEATCDTINGKVDYLGQTGLPELLNLRQYIAVVRTDRGNIVIDYTTSRIRDSSARSARIIYGNSVYLIRHNRDTIVDYPLEMLA